MHVRTLSSGQNLGWAHSRVRGTWSRWCRSPQRAQVYLLTATTDIWNRSHKQIETFFNAAPRKLEEIPTFTRLRQIQGSKNAQSLPKLCVRCASANVPQWAFPGKKSKFCPEHTVHTLDEHLTDKMLDRSECQKPVRRSGFRGIRSSKFRHVFGSPAKKQMCYDNVRWEQHTMAMSWLLLTSMAHIAHRIEKKN